jgi:hypothetical protein
LLQWRHRFIRSVDAASDGDVDGWCEANAERIEAAHEAAMKAPPTAPSGRRGLAGESSLPS